MGNTNTNTTAENQQVNTQPEENGTQRTFTQEEVNKIVSERLERDRSKRTDNSEYETRMNELKARESKFACKELVKECEYPEELLDLLDTSDVEKFAETTKKIDKIFRERYSPKITTSVPSGNFCGDPDPIAKAFKP